MTQADLPWLCAGIKANIHCEDIAKFNSMNTLRVLQKSRHDENSRLR